jgi:hypothetical protein
MYTRHVSLEQAADGKCVVTIKYIDREHGLSGLTLEFAALPDSKKESLENLLTAVQNMFNDVNAEYINFFRSKVRDKVCGLRLAELEHGLADIAAVCHFLKDMLVPPNAWAAGNYKAPEAQW